jgi:hypothetical protein
MTTSSTVQYETITVVTDIRDETVLPAVLLEMAGVLLALRGLNGEKKKN